MGFYPIFVLSTKTDRGLRVELGTLIRSTLGPSATQIVDVQWPSDALPWLSLEGPYVVVVPITRAALKNEKGWAQALTSHHVDTPRTIALFLSGLQPNSVREIDLRLATKVSAATLADGARELVESIKATLKYDSAPPKKNDVGFDIRQLIGRQRDIEEAKALAAPPTKSLAIIGLGGQGKTSFAFMLSNELSPQYEKTSWISLRTGPTLDRVAQQLAQEMGAEISVADATAETATANILRILSGRSVLLVLDNAESVFNTKPGVILADNSQDLAAHYEYFFRAVAEARISSLILVTSRELPTAYRLFPDSLRVMRLRGLDDSAVAHLLQASGIDVNPDLVRSIQERFLGNPLAVKLVCGLYSDRGRSVFAELFSQDSSVIDDISVLMDEHLSRLEDGERFLLSKIAWEGGSVTFTDLADLAWPLDTAAVQGYLGHLSRLLLVESSADSVSVSHPLLREHLVEEVKRALQAALLINDEQYPLPAVLSTLLLVNPLAEDYVQSEQIFALELLVSGVRRQLGTRHRVRTRILGLLEVARRSQRVGYTLANLVELARRAGVDLHGADFTNLPLDRVDFRGIDVRSADCSRATFRSCVFGDNFGPVTAVARIVTNQELLAAGTFEGFIRLWTPNGELHSAVKSANDWISAITRVTSEGISYFSAVDGGIGKIEWATLSVDTLTQVDAQVRALALADPYLVAACADGTLRLMNLLSGGSIKLTVADFRLKVARVLPGDLTPTVLLGGDSGELLFFDIETRTVSSRFLNGHAWVRDALFDHSGNWLFTADDDGKVRAWNRNPDGIYHLRGEASHSHRVWCLALDEAAALLYSAGNDSVIRVWEASSLRQVGILEGHGSWIRAMALVQGGRILVSGSEDQTLRFWRTEVGDCFRRRTGYARRVFAIGFSSDDVLVCGTGDHKVVKFELAAEHDRPKYFDGHRDQVFTIAVESRSNRIASASDDGEIRVWDLSAGDTVFSERLHTGWIGSVAFSPSGLRLVSGADDRTMVVVDAVHFSQITRKRTHDGRISGIVFAGEDTVVCSSEDGTVRVLELPSLRERLSFQLGAGPLYAVGIVGPERSAIVSGVGGKVWRIRLAKEAQPEVVAELAVNAIWSIDVSPDGRFAAIGTDDGHVAFLDIDPLSDGSIKTVRAHQRQVWCVRWAPSGHILASASEDGQIALWNRDGSLQKRLAPPLLYQDFRITEAEGLSPAERRHLLAMGAAQ